MLTFEEVEYYVSRVVFRPNSRFEVEPIVSYGQDVADEFMLTFFNRQQDTSYPPDYPYLDQEMTMSIRLKLSDMRDEDTLGRAMLNLAHEYDTRYWLHEHSEYFRVRVDSIDPAGLEATRNDNGYTYVKVRTSDYWQAPFHAHHEDAEWRFRQAAPDNGDSLTNKSLRLPETTVVY